MYHVAGASSSQTCCHLLQSQREITKGTRFDVKSKHSEHVFPLNPANTLKWSVSIRAYTNAVPKDSLLPGAHCPSTCRTNTTLTQVEAREKDLHKTSPQHPDFKRWKEAPRLNSIPSALQNLNITKKIHMKDRPPAPLHPHPF